MNQSRDTIRQPKYSIGQEVYTKVFTKKDITGDWPNCTMCTGMVKVFVCGVYFDPTEKGKEGYPFYVYSLRVVNEYLYTSSGITFQEDENNISEDGQEVQRTIKGLFKD